MFDIDNSADYYAMLVADFDDFMANPQSARHAIHCAITAYHLGDWVWHDWLKDREDVKAPLGVTSEGSFYEYLKKNVWFQILHEIANGSKHFKRQLYKTEHVRSYGSGPFGVGPYGAGYLLIDLGGGDEEVIVEEFPLDEFGEPIENSTGDETRYLPAVNLLEVIVRFWRDFFRKYRPDVTVEPSRNHTM